MSSNEVTFAQTANGDPVDNRWLLMGTEPIGGAGDDAYYISGLRAGTTLKDTAVMKMPLPTDGSLVSVTLYHIVGVAPNQNWLTTSYEYKGVP